MAQIPLDVLTRPFEAGQVKQRQGRGGKMLDYLETHAIITRLNEAFAGAWSFEVVDFQSMEGEVVVRGRLRAGGEVKEQFGSSEIARAKDSGKPVSVGDDLKAAASDALKKCATLFGIGQELYAKGGAQVPQRNGFVHQCPGQTAGQFAPPLLLHQPLKDCDGLAI